jgi:hypothetical protein
MNPELSPETPLPDAKGLQPVRGRSHVPEFWLQCSVACVALLLLLEGRPDVLQEQFPATAAIPAPLDEVDARNDWIAVLIRPSDGRNPLRLAGISPLPACLAGIGFHVGDSLREILARDHRHAVWSSSDCQIWHCRWLK